MIETRSFCFVLILDIQNGISKNIFIGLHKHFILDYSCISNWIIKTVFFIGLYEHFILDYSGISNWITKNFFIGILWYFKLDYSEVFNWIIRAFHIGLLGYFKLDYSEIFNWITWHASLSLPPAQTMALAFQGKLSPNI